jgi:DNA-binding beta-propeller fold protein YncE
MLYVHLHERAAAMSTATLMTACANALRKVPRALLGALMTLSLIQVGRAAPPAFIEFESGHVRPLAMSPDGTRLFAVNTPNNTLDVFDITGSGMSLVARVPVGMEPVAVAARSNQEVWVVNHLSDSVSVVSLTGVPHVVRTLLVGDEPRDIVFAGNPARAFITTAHRGQHRTHASIADVVGAGDPKLTTASIDRADVWVFSATDQGNEMGGKPQRILSYFADTPRALAVSPDRNTLYVAAFKSGNETAAVNEDFVCDGWNTTKTCLIKGKTMPGGHMGPAVNAQGKPAPEVGLIVKFNRDKNQWLDELGRNWNSAMQFRLPDKDVFAVDANTLAQKTSFRHVGTTLYNMATNPVTGTLYVSNSEANNMVRFEGSGKTGGSTVQGHIAMSRITVIDDGQVAPRHLNKHLDYSKLVTDPGFDTSARNHSLAIPMDIALTRDGQTMFVTAFGSSKIGVFNTADIEADTFNPRAASANYITVSGGGPSGLVLDEPRGRMYVMTRFDHAVKVISLGTRAEVAKAVLANPEPANIVAGRPFLYDAMRSSANGEASCASCHIFGDEDALAWDLGNPDDVVNQSAIPGKFTGDIKTAKALFGVKAMINGSDNVKDIHPMKGPMTTQTLRGMRNSGAMHWRGDRQVGIYGSSPKDSNLSFINFGVAFEGLLGNKEPMSREDMQTFADFQMNVMLPPNPVRQLDNSLTAAQERGRAFYSGKRSSDGFDIILFGKVISTGQNCNGCHQLDPAKGFYGTNGDVSFEGISQIMKIAHLRNMYQKVGRFGQPESIAELAPDTGFLGDQVRGFGFTHDGAIDTLAHFFTARVFKPNPTSGFPMVNPDGMRRDVTDFMMAFDSDLAPIVGQQITLHAGNAMAAGQRIDLMVQRAKTPFVSKELGGTVTECDLIASVVEGGARKGYWLDVGSGSFVDALGAPRTDAALRALAATPGQEVTYTCAPPGSGKRMAQVN